MLELVLALIVFVLSHVLPMHGPWRLCLEQRLGVRGFLLGYSLLSLMIIAWLVKAFLQAPFVLLWPWYSAAAWIPVLVMPFACVLVVAGISSRNPFSLGLGGAGYDAEHPGIVSVTRHPVMWAIVLWALAHIPVNGDLAAVLFFGLMLMLGLIGTQTIERNRRGRHNAAHWASLHAGTVNIPRLRARVDWAGIGRWRLSGGVALYVVLLFAHEAVIGLAPPPLAH